MLATDTNKESWIGLHGEDFKREAEAIITVTKNKYTKMNYIKENKNYIATITATPRKFKTLKQTISE